MGAGPAGVATVRRIFHLPHGGKQRHPDVIFHEHVIPTGNPAPSSMMPT